MPWILESGKEKRWYYESSRARIFIQQIESKSDLIEAIFNHRWPLCHGFYHKKLLYMKWHHICPLCRPDED